MHGPVEFLPADGLTGSRIDTVSQLLHGDAALHRADTHTQVTTHAFIIHDHKTALAVDRVGDGLMRRILADLMAASALDTTGLVNDCLFDVIEVQVLPVSNAGDGPADQVGYRCNSLLVQECAEAIGKVFDDASRQSVTPPMPEIGRLAVALVRAISATIFSAIGLTASPQ